MKLTSYQRDALDMLLARIDPRDPGFNASETVRENLEGIRNYLQAWVYPLIPIVAGADKYARQYASKDVVPVRKKRRDAGVADSVVIER